MIVYALLYPVSVLDILSIVDDADLRKTVRETLDPSSLASIRHPVTENANIVDESGAGTENMDNLMLSDSAQAITSVYYAVNATSILGISDAPSSGNAAYEAIALSESDTVQPPIADAFSVLDSVSRLMLVYITDSISPSDEVDTREIQPVPEEPEDRRNRSRGPDRTVYDESYFESRPLARTKVLGIAVADDNDSVLVNVEPGSARLSVSIRNFQNMEQPYIIYLQITDTNNIAVAIMEIPGSIEDGESTNVEAFWEAERGNFEIKAWVCDASPNPTVLSESLSRLIVVEPA